MGFRWDLAACQERHFSRNGKESIEIWSSYLSRSIVSYQAALVCREAPKDFSWS